MPTIRVRDSGRPLTAMAIDPYRARREGPADTVIVGIDNNLAEEGRLSHEGGVVCCPPSR